MDPYALCRAGLVELLADLGPPAGPQPAYRADQIQRWLVQGVDDPAEMTNLPAALRGQLAELLDPPPRVLRQSAADDGLTRKVLLDVPVGERSEAVESVLMLYPKGTTDEGGQRSSGRATVCISTQAGCAMGCPFCATGQAGYRGQLGLGAIVRQVTVMQRLLASSAFDTPGVPDHVTNVVFMGMGEPLANLDPTVAAVRWLHDPDGFGLSARSITVSTVGLVPGIRRLAELGLPITLAVSLHAADDALRDDLVPVNRQWPLATLMEACAGYREATGRRLTFEYVLIDGINAGLDHARRLADLVGGFMRDAARGTPDPAHVNLIPMNPTPAVPWVAPAPEEQHAFEAVLTRAGVPVTIRRNRGSEIDAACGQLYADYAVASGRTLPAARGAAQRLGLQPVDGETGP
jgi:23S rRNA (adenine2503-C2)-methyltransferase